MGKNKRAPILFKSLLAVAALLLILGAVATTLSVTVGRHGLPSELKAAPVEPPQRITPARTGRRGAAGTAAATSAALGGQEEYLNLLPALDPDYAAVQTLRELRQWQIRIWNEAGDLFQTREGAITPAEAQWLRRQREYFALLHRLAEAGQPPSLTFPELQEAIRKGGGVTYCRLHPAAGISQQGAVLLANQARLCLQEGDPDGARRALSNALKLGVNLSGSERFTDLLFAQACLGQGVRIAKWWLAQAKPGDSALRAMLKEVERANEAILPPDALRRNLTYLYLEERCAIVAQMETPTWRQPLYGWDPLRKPEAFQEYRFFNRAVQLPKPKQLLPITLTAMRNRMENEDALKRFDAFFRQAIAAAGGSYADFRKAFEALSASPMVKSFIFENYRDIAALTYEDVKFLGIRQLITEAECHLCRLGAARRIESEKISSRSSGGFRERLKEESVGQGHGAWRDPFTGQPMRMDDESTPTLIYSLGPDRQDQHGAVRYDPSNGTASGGDILMRLAR